MKSCFRVDWVLCVRNHAFLNLCWTEKCVSLCVINTYSVRMKALSWCTLVLCYRIWSKAYICRHRSLVQLTGLTCGCAAVKPWFNKAKFAFNFVALKISVHLNSSLGMLRLLKHRLWIAHRKKRKKKTFIRGESSPSALSSSPTKVLRVVHIPIEMALQLARVVSSCLSMPIVPSSSQVIEMTYPSWLFGFAVIIILWVPEYTADDDVF